MRPHLFAPIAWPPRSPESSPPLDVLEPLARAEAQGYAGVWLAEATPGQRGIGPLLHLAAAWLAARTQRIRIGVAGALLPSLHPLRLAEELAMLDALSAGRLCWAVEDTHDDPLLREQLAIVLLALSGEPFAWEGAHFELPELRCLPAAVQRPHPPLSIRAGCDDAVVRAARAGRRFWNDPLAPVAEVEASQRIYRDAARAAGPDAAAAARAGSSSRGLPLLRLVHVGETDAAARASAAPALLALARADERGSAFARDEAPDPDREPEAFVAFACEQIAIVGDESRCREQLVALRERLGPLELIAWHDFGGLAPEQVADSQERLAEMADSLTGDR